MSLPITLKPKKKFNILRFGRDNDGGYLVSKKTIIEAKTLISFGILDDCSFENDFLKTNEIKVHCFDHTIIKTYWLKRFYNDLGASLFNLNWPHFLNTTKRYFKSKKFFKNKKVNLSNRTITSGSIKEICSVTNLDYPLFFKVDIEGSEYRILEELIDLQNSICGLVIEFHDIDLHRERIEKFIKNFNLKITHIHANNFGPLDSNKNPTVIEMTFEKNPLEVDEVVTLPNNLDQPNNPDKPDIKIDFK